MTNANSTAVSAAADREISTVRVFDAPRELVWKVWTDPMHIEQWWGPAGFSTTTKEFALGAGGVWNHVMHGPDGTDYRNEITYTTIVEPELLEWIHGPSPVFDVTVRFTEEAERRTKISMRMVFSTAAERNHTVEKFKAIEGQRQMLDRLVEYLRKMAIADNA
jgi:uncharacterized protein YndB with AHSA1/START domain